MCRLALLMGSVVSRRTVQTKDWHPEDIKAAIRKAGATLTSLAQAHGYARASLTMVLKRRAHPPQAIIAAHLGVPPQKIWPSRYDDTGQPLDHRRKDGRINSRNDAAAQRQNQEAA